MTLFNEGENLKDEGHDGVQDAVLDPTYQIYFTFVQWFSVMFLWFQARYNVTQVAASFLLMLFVGLLSLLSHPIQVIFPSTIFKLNNFFTPGYDIDEFVLVVCPSETCNAVYSLGNACKTVDNRKVSCNCSAKHYGKTCGETLMYSKRLSNNRTTLCPHKIFLFRSPSHWLSEVYQSDTFRSLLGKRFQRKAQKGILEDVWDGRLWKKFLHDPVSKVPLLSEKNNIAFILNVDWVKPFHRGQYKFGVIYLSVLNLPRSDRLLKKWTHVLGIIPGPSELKTHINTFLKPMVDDLLRLWEGIDILLKQTNEVIQVRAMLLCVSCDMPAIRKVSQFLGHKAYKGCNICQISGEREYDEEGNPTGRMSYYSKSCKFVRRTQKEVMRQSQEYCSARNKTEAKNIAKENGVRYCELHRLPYFEPTRMCAVDPMHALLLGLVKKESEIHFEQESSAPLYRFAIKHKDRQEMKKRLKAIEMPSDCGRLPTSLLDKNSLDGVTAQQWLLYALVYARACLVNLIPRDAFQCMKILCKITDILAKHKLSKDDIEVLSNLLQNHHHMFSKLYGKWVVSINYHMILHIIDTLQDFGPCHVFWCFGYERMNGTIVDVPCSGRAVEKEMFQKFQFRQKVSMLEIMNILGEEFKNRLTLLCPRLFKMMNEAVEEDLIERTCHDNQIVRLEAEQFLSLSEEDDEDLYEKQCEVEMLESYFAFREVEMLPPQRMDKMMDSEMLEEVRSHLQNLFQDRFRHLSPRFDKFARCKVNGMNLSSALNRSECSSRAMAYWATNEESKPLQYFCKIHFFFYVRITVLNQEKECSEKRIIPFAYVDWYKPRNKNAAPDAITGMPQVRKAFYKGNHIIGINRLVQRVVTEEYGPSSYLVLPLQV